MASAILVVVAHPDDETIFFGGLIREFAAAGARVDVACAVTDFGSAELTATRCAEFKSACIRLGARPRMLGLSDMPGALSLPDLQQRLFASLRRRTYDAVYTHGVWGEYGHPHHRNVCLAVHRVFGDGVLSLAGPLKAQRVKALTRLERKAKLDVAKNVYRSQAYAAQWCSSEERFTAILSRDVEILSRAADGTIASRDLPASDPCGPLLLASLDAFQHAIPYAEIAHIPAPIWKAAHARFAGVLSNLPLERTSVDEAAESGTTESLGGAQRAVNFTYSRKHSLKKVLDLEDVIIFDDFLPENIYEMVHRFALTTDYTYINAAEKVSRAWHVHDGSPLRSTLNAFYRTPGSQHMDATDVYPTGTEMDVFIDHLLEIQPQVERLNGGLGKDWTHLMATAWIYPHGTGLAMHEDAGIYTGAYVYFLNPTWRPHWGGLLLLVDPEANQRVREYREHTEAMEFYKRKWLHVDRTDELFMDHGLARCIFPKRNRIVFIAPHAHHMVTRVNEQSGDNLRMSIAGFYIGKR